MYAPSFGGSAHHGTVVIPQSYKLLVKPVCGNWTHGFHKSYKYSFSKFQMIKLVEVLPHIIFILLFVFGINMAYFLPLHATLLDQW